MANQKVPQLPVLSASTGDDLLYIVDVQDTTDDPTGSSKQITRDNLLKNISGFTATTISATTYSNLPTDIRVTGGTYSAGTTTFTNNTGGTFSVTGFTTGSTLTTNKIWIGDNTNTPIERNVSGDINISISGVTTIQPNVVTYSKIQQISTNAVLGSQSVSGGIVEEIPIIDAYITSGSSYSLITNTSNWDIDGIYTGSSITNTYQGQSCYDSKYWYTAVDDNNWVRLIRG
jgi:hypothetical protein